MTMTSRSEVLTEHGELVTIEPPRTLFRTDDPAEVLQSARAVAAALKDALTAGGMVQRIRDKEHVKIEGWQTLGSMLGVAPIVAWSRPLEDGWEARAEARTHDGRLLGAGEAMCTRQETNWRNSDEYAIRSMAQTRAMSKALSGPLRFIMTLAGYSGTPAEELEQAYGPAATSKQTASMQTAIAVLYDTQDAPTDVVDRLRKDAGGYIPKIVARAVQLVASYRPTREPANGEEVAEQLAADR
jgi:hypothetical protein